MAKKIPLILAFLLLSALAPCAKDLSDYPLKVEILANHWDRYRPRPVRDPAWWVYRVSGQGNIIDGGAVRAFDFKYQDAQVARHTLANQSYPARWKKPQRELEVLTPDVGHEGKYIAFEMDTTVLEGVYVGRGASMAEVSQAEYLAQKAKGQTTTSASAGQPAGAASALEQPPAAPGTSEQPAATSSLSITSTPAGADIDVDGELVGMTPSVLQLSLGEHTIVLHKASFKDWQRKMKVVAGDIKLNADLEPASVN